jgi:hypothetical protein
MAKWPDHFISGKQFLKSPNGNPVPNVIEEGLFKFPAQTVIDGLFKFQHKPRHKPLTGSKFTNLLKQIRKIF